jgi:TonB family protein
MSIRTAACSCGQLTAQVAGEPVRISIYHCLACGPMLLCFSILLAACSQEPLSPYPGGDTVVQQIQALATHGDAQAEVKLGEMYEYGKGVPQDYAKADALYEKSAAQGNRDGEIHLADYMLLHLNNYLGAIKWDRKAMEQGSTIAAADLWYLYYYCLGVPCGLPDIKDFYAKAMVDREGEEEVFYMTVDTELMRTRNTERTTGGKTIFGMATVGFDVGDDGVPKDLVIVKSSGNPDVDKAVMKSVLDTRVPPVALGKDISHHYVYTLNYVP